MTQPGLPVPMGPHSQWPRKEEETEGRLDRWFARQRKGIKVILGCWFFAALAFIHSWNGDKLFYIWCAALLFVAPVIIYIFYNLITGFNRAWDQATAPVPDLMQIKAQLEAEGYTNLTLADLTAVHAYLTRRRNEGLMAVGVTLGAIYLMHHEGRL